MYHLRRECPLGTMGERDRQLKVLLGIGMDSLRNSTPTTPHHLPSSQYSSLAHFHSFSPILYSPPSFPSYEVPVERESAYLDRK